MGLSEYPSDFLLAWQRFFQDEDAADVGRFLREWGPFLVVSFAALSVALIGLVG